MLRRLAVLVALAVTLLPGCAGRNGRTAGLALGALATFAGAVVLVTHDEGAVNALQPERVLLLPDGDEDLWGEDYLELVSLA